MEFDTTHLRQILTERFSDDELRTLCFDLGLDYALLPGEGKGGKARELVAYLVRRERLSELVEVGQQLRPDIRWAGEALDLPKLSVPHNLPPRSEFVGRETEKGRVYEALLSRSYLISIDGIGGIGKTSLALEVAHECLQASREANSFDGKTTFAGFIWASAKDRDLALDDLLDAVARTLDYPGIAQRPVGEKREAVQRLLREQSYLLLMDNLETVTDESVRDFLLRLPEPSKAIITTREQTLRQVWAISIKGLAEETALELIRSSGRRLGLQALAQAEDSVLLRLYHATGGAPLAIKWAIGQIKQRGQSLDSVLAALYEARGDIFEEVFVHSWDLLSPEARQVLIMMPLFAAPASRAEIEVASDAHHFALDEALGQLVEMSLVEPLDIPDLTARRYTVHSLTRAFAAARLREAGGVNQERHRQLALYYQSMVETYRSTEKGVRAATLEQTLPNILVAVQRCWEHSLADLGIELVGRLRYFLIVRGYWNDMLALAQQASAIAIEQGNEVAAAELGDWPIAWIYRHRGELDAAKNVLEGALAVFQRHDEKKGIADAKRHLGRVAIQKGNFQEAELLFGQAQSLYMPSQHEREYYWVMADLANLASRRGDLDTAWRLCNSILDSARQFGDPERLAHIVGIMAWIAHAQGDFALAIEYARESLALARKVERIDSIADKLFWLAVIEIKLGDFQSARPRLLQALDIYRKLDMPDKVQRTRECLATLEQEQGYVNE